MNVGDAQAKHSGIDGSDEEGTAGGKRPLLKTKAIEEKSEMTIGGE